MPIKRPSRPTHRNMVDANYIKTTMFNYNRKNPYQHHYIHNENDSSECPICAVPTNGEHTNSLKHRFNFALWQWKKYRQGLIKNRNGIEVSVTPLRTGSLKYFQNDNDGSHVLQGTPQEANLVDNKFTFHIEIKNTGQSNTLLLNFNFLYPYPCFRIDDYLNLMTNEKVLLLEQGATYFFKVHVELPDCTNGHFKLPFVLNFLNGSKNQDFDIIRQVVVIISDVELDMTELSKHKRIKPNFEKVEKFVPPNDAFRSTVFQIPLQFKDVLTKGLNESRAINSAELCLMRDIKRKMKLDHPDKTNYDDFFHFVLWMDEIGEEIMTSQFNLNKVRLIYVKNEKLFELEVEGLAEKRPSLLKNDIVNIKQHGKNETAYQGKIIKLLDRSIYIGSINSAFYQLFDANPKMEVDISFQPNRIHFERMHMGAQYTNDKRHILNSLFPSKSQSFPTQQHLSLSEEDVFDKEIYNNPEQKQAVENILNHTSGNYPYIVFGPPGTGKTMTIVEAVLQIKRKVANCNILVCAPANAACNMLASKLIPWCRQNELIRVHSSSNPWNGVPADVKQYSNWKNGDYVTMYGDQLQKFAIVVTTLVMSGRYLNNKDFSPQYVFIDEAAQATEPEAVIAVALLAKKFQLVLAGDPKQLGPIVVSKAAKKYYLHVSLLERLMSNELYANNDPDYITMLRFNFRAHPQVLHLPNTIFYNDQLEAMSMKALKDSIASICVYHKINPPSKKYKLQNKKCTAAIEFYAIFSEEKREQGSPSYFNPEEVNMVAKTVSALCRLTETKVEQDDIGVITPYISQVHKIKMRLKDRGFPEVEVGSTETFQGREKRIIIISTVRAQQSLLLYDAKYKLGFVKNPQRFNVALTRAMSKLIVIGCPNVLRYDAEHWLKYIDYCISCNSYFGAPFDRRTEETMKEVVRRCNQIKFCQRR